jgi:hypothetical protein
MQLGLFFTAQIWYNNIIGKVKNYLVLCIGNNIKIILKLLFKASCQYWFEMVYREFTRIDMRI